jgi:hypothetical protein|tara:strand:- start:657 stop:842 length:186 start_codon:yes stop_codon:yes gene_type:complete
MDIRFLIVGSPFIIAFFYTLFWLKRWGAFNSPDDNLQKKMTLKNESIEQSYFLENIFLTKN